MQDFFDEGRFADSRRSDQSDRADGPQDLDRPSQRQDHVAFDAAQEMIHTNQIGSVCRVDLDAVERNQGVSAQSVPDLLEVEVGSASGSGRSVEFSVRKNQQFSQTQTGRVGFRSQHHCSESSQTVRQFFEHLNGPRFQVLFAQIHSRRGF